MKRFFQYSLICLVASQLFFGSHITLAAGVQRRATQKQTAAKAAAELKAGREQVAAQIKILTHFLYVFSGLEKSVQSAESAPGSRDASPAAIELNQRSKTKLRESIRTVREGLEKFETDFRANSTMTNYFPLLFGTADLAQTAENQAAANRLDDAGKSLLKAVDRLTDALAAMR